MNATRQLFFITALLAAVALGAGCQGTGSKSSGGGGGPGATGQTDFHFLLSSFAREGGGGGTTGGLTLPSSGPVGGATITVDGVVLAVRQDNGATQQFQFSLVINDETIEVNTNLPTLPLDLAVYNFYFLMNAAGRQYAGIAKNWLILEGQNSVSVKVNPVLGQVISDVTQLGTLSEFNFQIDSTLIASLSQPRLGLSLNGGPEVSFAVNPVVFQGGTSTVKVLVFLPTGPAQVRARFYDGSELQAANPPEQEQVEIGANPESFDIDVVPVAGQTNYNFVPTAEQAVFHLVVPSLVFEVAGGASNVQATFSLVGPQNELYEVIGQFNPSGSNYQTEVVVPAFVPGSVTWQLSFYDTSASPPVPYGSCGNTITVSGEPSTLFCNFTLWAKPTPEAPTPARVLVTVNDGSPVAGAIVTVDGELVGITHAVSGTLEFLIAAGTHSVRVTSADGQRTSEGSLTVAAGENAALNLTLPPPAPPSPGPDTRPPVVHITTPTGVTNDQTPRLSYTTDEAGTVTVILGGTYVPTRNDQDLPLRPDGTYTLTVQVQDAAGNVGGDTVTFTIDTKSPAISIQSPTGATNSREPLLAYSTDGLVTDVVLDTGSVVTRNSQTLPDRGEGEHTVTVYVRDPVGNQSSASVTYQVDLTAPQVSIVQPSGTVNVADPIMEYTLSEPATVLVTLTGPQGTSIVTTGNREPLLPLVDGDYTLKVQATDGVGNQTSVSRTFTVDTSPALVTILKPKGITPNNQPVLEYELGEPGQVLVVLDDGVVEVPNGGNLPLLADGEHTVTVMVIDAAGNRSQASVTFDVNATAPAITVVRPVGVVNSRDPVLEYSTSEAGEAAVTVDGVAITVSNGGTLYGPDGPLADGEHTVTVSITDQLNRVATDSATFRVDTLAPVVEILAPTGLTTNPTPLLDFRVTDADPKATWTVSLDGHPLEIASGEPLPEKEDGDHTLRVDAQDSVGNASSVSARYRIDTKAPVVTITKPDAGPTRDNTPLLEYTADERGSVTVLLDGEPVPTRSGQQLHTALGEVLPDGNHTVEVQVVDAAGQRGSDARKFSVDATAPRVKIGSPEEGSLINRSFVNIVFTSNEDGDAKVVINDGTEYTLSAKADNPVDLRIGPLKGGRYQVTVSVSDRMGNTGTAEVNFRIDHRAPAVDIKNPTGTTNQRRPLLVYAVDEDGEVEVFLNGSPVTTRNGERLSSPDGGDLADGDYTLTVQATDAAGNVTKRDSTFTVDGTSPLVTIEYPGDGSTIPTATPVLVFSSSESGTAKVSVNGGEPSELPVTGGTLVEVQVGPLPDGPNTVRVDVDDGNGNVRTATRGFTVDTRPPVVSIQQPEDESDDESPLLVYSYDEPGTETVLLDSKEIKTRSGEQLPEMGEGTHTVEVQVRDAVGNVGSDSLTFSVDPARPITSFDLKAKRVLRPTRRYDGRITFDGKAKVEIPDTSAISVLTGNSNRYLVLLKLGDVRCVYLGGDYNAPFGGEPEWDLFKLFRSPVCGLGRYKAGDQITVEGSVSLRVLFGDPEAEVTKVKLSVPIVETDEDFALTDEDRGHRHGHGRWHKHDHGHHADHEHKRDGHGYGHEKDGKGDDDDKGKGGKDR